MHEVALVLEMVGAVVVVPAVSAWLGLRARRRGIGGSVLAPFEEIWDPTSHRTDVAVHQLAERRAPAPAPGDPPSPRPLPDGSGQAVSCPPSPTRSKPARTIGER